MSSFHLLYSAWGISYGAYQHIVIIRLINVRISLRPCIICLPHTQCIEINMPVTDWPASVVHPSANPTTHQQKTQKAVDNEADSLITKMKFSCISGHFDLFIIQFLYLSGENALRQGLSNPLSYTFITRRWTVGTFTSNSFVFKCYFPLPWKLYIRHNLVLILFFTRSGMQSCRVILILIFLLDRSIFYFLESPPLREDRG